MSWLTNLFKDTETLFANPQAKLAEKTIAALLPVALTVVTDINAMAPNRTLAEINTVASKYGVPAIAALASDPIATNNVLLNLATAIVQTHAPTTPISLVNTTVQFAVTAARPPAKVIGRLARPVGH